MIETRPERVVFGSVLAVLAVLGVDDAVVSAMTPWSPTAAAPSSSTAWNGGRGAS